MSELSFHQILHLMALSREGDRREGILFRQGRGWLQVPAAGHESLASLAGSLRAEDYIFPYYRERALALARGVSNYEIALAFFGKGASCSAGRQMSNHYSDPQRRIFPSATLTGLQCLPAAGAAWACRRASDGSIALCCIGDASVRQGEFYEALCFALQNQLPLVFVIEDNGYGISTPTAGTTPWDIGALCEHRRTRVNGRDAIAVYKEGRAAIEAARSGGGPQVLWLDIDRLWSHTASDDHRLYRPADELEAMTANDPITLLKDKLIQGGELAVDDWQVQLQEIARQVDDDYARAEAAENPLPRDVKRHLFSGAQLVPRGSVVATAGAEHSTMIGALNATLQHALLHDDRVIMLGEDIEDPKGGVFGLTKGLSTQFPGRVVNSPLAEATIAGTAVGLAVAGYLPVFEIQFIDFIGPAFNQIVNQIATLRWRSAGAWKCPLVLLAPCGAYLPAGGPWHSQMNESWFIHTPGLQVAIPSTPQDASALLQAAIGGEDPVLMLLPKHLFRRRFETVNQLPLAFGEAAVRRQGSDVTIVAWGNCVEIGEAAAATLAGEGIAVEVLDLRTLVPCDWSAIRASLAKTGRLLVVQEDNKSCSFGQAIISEMTADPSSWNTFAAPPRLLARDDVHMPFHPVLEEAILPGSPDICEAVRLLMKY